jgi:hypothetical protein
MQEAMHYKGGNYNFGIWQKSGWHFALIKDEDTFVGILAHVDS